MVLGLAVSSPQASSIRSIVCSTDDSNYERVRDRIVTVPSSTIATVLPALGSSDLPPATGGGVASAGRASPAARRSFAARWFAWPCTLHAQAARWSPSPVLRSKQRTGARFHEVMRRTVNIGCKHARWKRGGLKAVSSKEPAPSVAQTISNGACARFWDVLVHGVRPRAESGCARTQARTAARCSPSAPAPSPILAVQRAEVSEAALASTSRKAGS
jgi:hypothetical protein